VKRLCQGLALAVVAAAPVMSVAQEERKTSQEQAVQAEVKATEPAGPNTGNVSVSGGVDFTTAYFFRGYNQEDQGVLIQPYANLYFKLVNEESFKATYYLGTWNSLHSEHTLAAGTGPDAWYESDFLTGLDLTFGKFTVGAIYTAYNYPNGAFNTIEELGAKIAYDDTDFQKGKLGFALKPYFAAYAETADGNGSEDWYGELGIAPTVYTVNPQGKYPIALSLPIIAGLNLKDYYFDDDGHEEFLGYISASLVASVPLPFMPSQYGTWSLTGSFQYLYLNAEGLQTANHGEDYELIGKVGIAFAY
jgi:hypothetical protein